MTPLGTAGNSTYTARPNDPLLRNSATNKNCFIQVSKLQFQNKTQKISKNYVIIGREGGGVVFDKKIPNYYCLYLGSSKMGQLS